MEEVAGLLLRGSRNLEYYGRRAITINTMHADAVLPSDGDGDGDGSRSSLVHSCIQIPPEVVRKTDRQTDIIRSQYKNLSDRRHGTRAQEVLGVVAFCWVRLM